MADIEKLESLFSKHNFPDFKWIDPKQIDVGQWVRMKCMFGCVDYGKNASCPPNVPSVAECRQFFDDYESGIIFHFDKAVDKPEDRFEWTRKINLRLASLEKDIFLSGYHKAFVLVIDSCTLCDECVGTRGKCKKPRLARPTAEAMAVDVYSTVRKYDFPIQVLADYSKAMNRYAFMLVD